MKHSELRHQPRHVNPRIQVISYYAEPESFEAFVPDGWIGKYQDFTEEIPEKQRYWMDENGKNLIGE